VLQALKNIFSNIGSRLVNSNLEDWGLDSSTDLSAGTAEVDKSCPYLSIGAYSFICGEIYRISYKWTELLRRASSIMLWLALYLAA
jgi:hypothetical protein